MATNSLLSTVQNVRSSAPMFNTFNPLKNTTLFARISWIYVGCLAAGAAYCLSNLYQAYQLKSRASFELGDRYKLIKCQALLAEAREQKGNHADALPLLQQCESLLNSIKDKMNLDHKKDKFLLELVYFYVNDNPNRSYQIAQELSSPDNLFNAAKSIQKNHPDFDTDKLHLLFIRAFEPMISPSQHDRPLTRFYKFLEFVEVFNSVKDFKFSNSCMDNALNLVQNLGDDLTQIKAFCQIAKCYQKIEVVQAIRYPMQSAQSLSNNIENADSIQAHLVCADALFALENFEQMDEELDKVTQLMNSNDPLQTVENLYSLTALIIKIGKTEKVKSYFKQFEVKPFIDKALRALANASLEELTTENQVKAYLNIVCLYQEDLINDPTSKTHVLSQVFAKIQDLPATTEREIRSKVGSLFRLVCYCEKGSEQEQLALQTLKDLYDRYPLDDRSDFVRKLRLGEQIVGHYNKTGMEELSESFFQKHLLNFRSNNEKVFRHISNLVVHAEDDDYLPEQRRALLEAAELLLPELTSSNEYDDALATIIEGYLQVDRQKSSQLLENYASRRAHQKAMSCVTVATITAITMGVLRFYPQAAPIFSLGFTVVPILRCL